MIIKDDYLSDVALLQMFLHCFPYEKLLLTNLHPRVFLHNIFQDGLVRNSSSVVTILRRKVNKKSHRLLFKTTKQKKVAAVLRVCTHLNSFDDDTIHSVLSACKVGNRNFFSGSDASPRRNRPFHLLGFGLLVLVAVLQPVAERSKTQVQWSGSFL